MIIIHAINELLINIQKIKSFKESITPCQSSESKNERVMFANDTNNSDALVETFYSNVDKLEREADEETEDVPEAINQIVPRNEEDLKEINPRLSEYIERNEYERVVKTNRKMKLLHREKRKERKPKCVPNCGLNRLFIAYSAEIIYEKLSQLIEDGSISKRYPATASFQDDEIPMSSHPIINYPLIRFFNHMDYEHFMAKLLLPPIFKFQDSCNNNPRNILIAYAKCLHKNDMFIKFNGKEMTFKSLVFTFFNAQHLSENKTLKKLFSTKPSFETDFNTAEGRLIEKFLYKLWMASKNAIYISAISAATQRKPIVTRFDSADLYECKLTGKYLPKMDNSETIYYNNKGSGGWIYRLSNDKNKKSYYADDIVTVFEDKIKTVLKI